MGILSFYCEEVWHLVGCNGSPVAPFLSCRTILMSNLTLYYALLWWMQWRHHVNTFCSHTNKRARNEAVFILMCLSHNISSVATWVCLWKRCPQQRWRAFGPQTNPSPPAVLLSPPGPMKGILIGQGMSVSWNNECWISSVAASLFSLAGHLSPEDLGYQSLQDCYLYDSHQ